MIGDTVGDPFKDTSGPSLNILIKLMSVISLTMAPLMAGNEDWPSNWYIGLVCIVVLIIGTYLVYYFFWRNVDQTFDTGLKSTQRNESAKSSAVSMNAVTGAPIDEEAPPEHAPSSTGTPTTDEEPPTIDATNSN